MGVVKRATRKRMAFLRVTVEEHEAMCRAAEMWARETHATPSLSSYLRALTLADLERRGLLPGEPPGR